MILSNSGGLFTHFALFVLVHAVNMGKRTYLTNFLNATESIIILKICASHKEIVSYKM